jgi:hypothetical protein
MKQVPVGPFLITQTTYKVQKIQGGFLCARKYRCNISNMFHICYCKQIEEQELPASKKKKKSSMKFMSPIVAITYILLVLFTSSFTDFFHVCNKADELVVQLHA